jgi:hypothetical protein
MVALTVRCILSTSRAERLSLRLVRALVPVRGLGWTLVLGWLASSIRASTGRAKRLSLGLVRGLISVLDLGLGLGVLCIQVAQVNKMAWV